MPLGRRFGWIRSGRSGCPGLLGSWRAWPGGLRRGVATRHALPLRWRGPGSGRSRQDLQIAVSYQLTANDNRDFVATRPTRASAANGETNIDSDSQMAINRTILAPLLTFVSFVCLCVRAVVVAVAFLTPFFVSFVARSLSLRGQEPLHCKWLGQALPGCDGWQYGMLWYGIISSYVRPSQTKHEVV